MFLGMQCQRLVVVKSRYLNRLVQQNEKLAV